MRCDRVLLIGPRAAGKSTLGPLLASRLELRFVDADRQVEGREDATVAELLAAGRFRDAERRVLGELLHERGLVVAAGGGCVLWEGFANASRAWKVVWLDAPAEVLARRLRDDAGDRPSLTGPPPDQEIARIKRERDPLYGAVAGRRWSTEGCAPEELVEEITAWLLESGPSESRWRE